MERAFRSCPFVGQDTLTAPLFQGCRDQAIKFPSPGEDFSEIAMFRQLSPQRAGKSFGLKLSSGGSENVGIDQQGRPNQHRNDPDEKIGIGIVATYSS